MKSTRDILVRFSSYCYAQYTLYKFNKRVLKISEKYREGRLAAINYSGDLTHYYMNEEKKIRNHLVEQIDRQMKENSCLSEGEYKNGLYDGLNDVLDEYKRLSKRTNMKR